jgi:SAM-dependent methyltransferase
MGYKIKEGPVSWHHVDGAKINLISDSLKMFFNILQVRNWHCTPINTSHKYLGPDEYGFMYEMEDDHWWFVSRRNLVLELIKSLRMPFPTILDVGSGTGRNLLEFNKIGKAVGIDVARQAVEFCNKRGLKNVTQCFLEQMNYSDNSFDIITCLDVLEHVLDPVKALSELKRVLKNNGRIIITVPAFRILWSQHDEALCHFRRYEKDSLLNDLREARLQIQIINYFFLCSFFAVFPIRIIRKLLIPQHKLISDTTTLPPRFLNEFLKLLFKLEIKLAMRSRLPFGSTLYAVASK